MFNKNVLILVLLLLIIIICFILFKILNTKTIETFDSTPIIPYKILGQDATTITRKSINLSQYQIYNYYSIFEVVETSNENKYYFNVYYSYKTTNQIDNIFSNLFINSDISRGSITFTKPSNRPLPPDTNTNADGSARKSANSIINQNYIVVDFINQYGNDTKYRISTIKIAVENSSINNNKSIQFYFSTDTSKTTDPYQMALSQLLYIDDASIVETRGNINIFTYNFYTSIIEPPSIDDITIYFATDNDVKLYYINIYGIPDIQYTNILSSVIQTTQSANRIFDGTDVSTSDNFNYGGNAKYSGDVDASKNAANLSTDFDSLSLGAAFKKVIQNNIPWGMYNGGDILVSVDASKNTNIKLRDLLGRACRNAIINDPNNELNGIITNEEAYYNGYDVNGKSLPAPQKTRIKHLKASNNLSIYFPIGSLPYKYTICAITRYTSADLRSRIITTKNYYPNNFFLGHWAGNKNTFYNNFWATENNSGSDTNWLVSCAKSTGNENQKQSNSKYNTVIFDGKSLGKVNYVGNGYLATQIQDTNNILTINGIEPSNFGLSYLIIWDQILTDSELDLVSKNLINSLLDDSYQIPLSLTDILIINSNDGLSPDRSVDNPKAIVNNTCSIIDGYYWINILNIKRKIYCILDDKVGTFGGGWMLAMKGAKDKGTFMFNSSYWTTNNTLNETTFPDNILQDTTTEIKTNIFNFYKFSEILIIYNDPRFNNKKYYKTSYYKLNNVLISGKYSLSEFFANNLNDFNYDNIDINLPLNLNYAILNFNSISTPGCVSYGKKGISYQKFLNNFLTDPNSFNYTPDTFSQQNVCCAYGINLNFNSGPWGTLVSRIGAVFNENPGTYFQSIDVCGGIGLNSRYSAGDVIGCCHSSAGINSSLPFLLFVR